jgi:hypothetical protein
MYNFRLLSVNDLNSIQQYNIWNINIFSTKEWISFIEIDQEAKPIIIEIERNKLRIGYFIALKKKILGISIIGSPFRGWSTCFMGFVLDESEKAELILPEIAKYLFKEIKCHYIEIIDRNLNPDNISKIEFNRKMLESLEMRIDKSEEALLSEMKPDCRNFLRQFEKRGATIEIAEPNEQFADEYFDELKDVFSKQNLIPTYTSNKIKRLIFCLKDSSMLLCLRVLNNEGKPIASSIFIGFKEKFFYWGGASLREFQSFRPNEAMIWYAIKYWKGRGCKIFDMMGVRDYKLKFGAKKVQYYMIMIAKYPFLIWARNMGEKAFYAINNVHGKMKGRVSLTGSNLERIGNLKILNKLDQEIVHWVDEKGTIFSKFNKMDLENNDGISKSVFLPIKVWQRVLGSSRLVRRMLRLDKSCVVRTRNGLVAFWQGFVYHIPEDTLVPRLVLRLEGCRNPLHRSVAVIDGEELFFGEYGQPSEMGKSIYRSRDCGLTWDKVYTIPCTKIRHIHSCKWDPFEQKIWVFTGDFEGQSYVLCADKEFKNVEWIGDGSQSFRAVDAFFTKDEVHWIMDSPLTEVRHIILDRRTRTIRKGALFSGPVWYLKQFTDGVVIACTAQEIGPSHKDKLLHMMATRNLSKWTEIATFEHDGFKKGLMKFGVAAFAEGSEESSSFYVHFEAVKGLDGKSVLFSLTGI